MRCFFPENSGHNFLCTMHSLQSKCACEPFANPLVLKLTSVCHWTKPMTIMLKVPSQVLMVSKKLMGTVAMQLVHCAQETMISLFWYLFLSMKAVVFFHDWISLKSIPVKSKSEEWKLCWHELFWIGSKNYISTLRIKRRNLVHLHKYSIKKDCGAISIHNF